MSRFALFSDAGFVAAMPGADSPVWLPARAALGDPAALLILVAIGAAALAGTIGFAASGYGRSAIAAAGIAHQRTVQRQRSSHFRPRSVRQQLRIKEWKLLARDPWLLSQTLMQILYLVPPALFLWVSYGQSAGTYVVVIPVVVMAAGQLAGGLSWLAISGEDAHDLMVTAPIPPRAVLLAKIEAVLVTIAAIFAPVLLLMGLGSWVLAGWTALFVAISASSATAIQLWFRIPMRRSMFRRRQVASRAATISEALSSIMWAGTAVLAAGEQMLALLPAAFALIVMLVAWALSPRGKRV